MEFRGVYLVWALLPLLYISLTVWVYLRPFFKVAGREKIDQYYPSLFWTAGCYVLTLIVDQFGVVEWAFNFLVDLGIFGPDLQVEILRFLLYPAVLLAVAQIQRIVTGEDSEKKRTLPKSKWR